MKKTNHEGLEHCKYNRESLVRQPLSVSISSTT